MGSISCGWRSSWKDLDRRVRGNGIFIGGSCSGGDGRGSGGRVGGGRDRIRVGGSIAGKSASSRGVHEVGSGTMGLNGGRSGGTGGGGGCCLFATREPSADRAVADEHVRIAHGQPGANGRVLVQELEEGRIRRRHVLRAAIVPGAHRHTAKIIMRRVVALAEARQVRPRCVTSLSLALPQRHRGFGHQRATAS